MRRSAALFGAAAVFILVAVAAVGATLAARVALSHAAVGALVTLFVLFAAMARYERNRPASLKIGPDDLSLWNRDGKLIAQGAIAGCAQWGGWLLTLALVGDNGRSRPLLIAADMLPADIFRDLAVRARRAAQG